MHQDSFKLASSQVAMRFFGWLPAVTLCVLIQGCSRGTESETVINVASPTIPTVVVTNSVVGNVVKTLCEDQVSVVRVLNYERKANWRPSVEDVAKMQAADLILLSGSNYEPWVTHLSLPRSRLIDTSVDYADRCVAVTDSVTHQHGPSGKGTGTKLAWATWLDPELAILQVRSIEEAVCRLLPGESKMFVERSNALSAELEELDQRIETLAAQAEGLVAAGDPMQHSYLVRRLNWKLIPVTTETEAQESDFDMLLHSDDESVGRVKGPTVRVRLCDLLEDSENPIQCMTANLDRLQIAAGSARE